MAAEYFSINQLLKYFIYKNEWKQISFGKLNALLNASNALRTFRRMNVDKLRHYCVISDVWQNIQNYFQT